MTSERLDSSLRLHGYQLRAMRHLLENPRAGLFLEAGLGKTATVLCSLQEDHFPVLVVSLKRVVENVWEREAGTWRPDLTVSIAAGPPSRRKERLAAGAHITAISVDNLKDVQPGSFRTVVFDESSLFKNRGTRRWRMASKLAREAERVYLLTGTPIPNGYMDLWSQIYLLDQGQRLESGITRFRNRYFTPGRRLPNGVIVGWDINPGSSERIERLIGDICLSMRSEDHLDLPPVVYNRVSVPLPGRAGRVYRDLNRDLVADLRNEGGERYSAMNAAVLTAKLSQVTAGFLYPDEDGEETAELHDEKTSALQEIVAGTGSPVLVFYRFKEELRRIRQALPESELISSDSIERWNRGEVPVLLAHPDSAGHGLNLQKGGHVIVWTTPTWSSERWQQANARLARQGQQSSVIVHILVSPDTVDTDMLDVAEGKIRVQDGLMRSLQRTTRREQT